MIKFDPETIALKLDAKFDAIFTTKGEDTNVATLDALIAVATKNPLIAFA